MSDALRIAGCCVLFPSFLPILGFGGGFALLWERILLVVDMKVTSLNCYASCASTQRPSYSIISVFNWCHA